MAAPPPLHPLLPLAKRLNRNALIVSAVILGMTVLTAVVVVHSGSETLPRPSAPPAVDDAAAAPSRPTFLDQPVRVPAAPPPDTAVIGARAPSGGRETARRLGTAEPGDPAAGLPPGPGGPSARERAYQAALASPAVAAARAPAPAGGPAQPDSAPLPLAAQEQQLLNLGDSVLRAAGRPPTGGALAPTASPRE